MQYYTGIKPPDKTNNQILIETISKGLIQTIHDWIEAGFSREDAIERAKQDSCAGVAVWKNVLTKI